MAAGFNACFMRYRFNNRRKLPRECRQDKK